VGAFTKLFGKIKAKATLGSWFEMLDGYTPAWTTYDGGVYEMELTRACIHTFASHCSKLQPKVTGPDKRGIQSILDGKPNLFMTCSQFVYKAATLYEALNTVYIVPVLDQFDRLVGYYPVAADMTELREKDGTPYLVYTFGNGQTAAVELDRVGVVSKFLYRSDLVGESNAALEPTLQLLDTQNQGIKEGIKNSASFRFMATINNFSKGKDLARERKTWVEENLGADAGGLALFPNTYTNVQQIQSAARTVDPEQMAIIQQRVYTYFGTSEKILTNAATGDDWSAYYEGKIEPFALQLAQAMTAMTYTHNERTRKNGIIWSANRLQYMTNADKLQTSSQLFDRGVLSINDVMDIWALPHVPGGDKRYIRKEYTAIDQLDQQAQPTPPEPTEGPGKEEPNNGNTKPPDQVQGTGAGESPDPDARA
jgi:hypothetical protein